MKFHSAKIGKWKDCTAHMSWGLKSGHPMTHSTWTQSAQWLGWGAAWGNETWTTLPCWSSDHPAVPTPPQKALCDDACALQETSRNIKEPLRHASQSSYILKWYNSIVGLQKVMCASVSWSQPFGKTPGYGFNANQQVLVWYNSWKWTYWEEIIVRPKLTRKQNQEEKAVLLFVDTAGSSGVSTGFHETNEFACQYDQIETSKKLGSLRVSHPLTNRIDAEKSPAFRSGLP